MGVYAKLDELRKAGVTEEEITFSLKAFACLYPTEFIEFIEGCELPTLDEQFEEIREEYNLPNYEEERYRQFCVDMCKASIKVIHYNGRYWYKGPAVVWPRVSDIKEKTSILLQHDNMGLEYVVYPK